MITYPALNPIALHIGPIKIYWYGIMYLLGFLFGWVLMQYRAKKNPSLNWTKDQISDLIFYLALGVVIGGRVGYMLFYDFPNFIHHPLILFKTWEGGMAFHGGLLGVLIAIWIFGKKHQKTFFDIGDFVAPVVPIGLGLGRIGNFINGELWGRFTTVPWGMVYPHVDNLPRHPSQIYEFFLEGVLLFLIMWFYSAKPKPRMAVSGVFLLSYGLMRMFAELYRQPDAQYGFIAFGWLTMGQLLSFPMILLGVILCWSSYHCNTLCKPT